MSVDLGAPGCMELIWSPVGHIVTGLMRRCSCWLKARAVGEILTQEPGDDRAVGTWSRNREEKRSAYGSQIVLVAIAKG